MKTGQKKRFAIEANTPKRNGQRSTRIAWNLESQLVGRHALVVGGSLAGLLAARVLCDHFESVTVIERDAFPKTPEPRRGVPQANHAHALLMRGCLILEQLFPGFRDEMIAAGAPLIDMAEDIAWLTPGGWGVRFPSDLKVLSFTRHLLDLHVRRRVAAEPRVRILENTEIVRLFADEHGRGIAGAQVRSRTPASEKMIEMKLDSDLVVDATGRGSQAPRWLKDLGYPPPRETVINAHLGYASRLYQIPAGFSADWKCLFVQSAPPESKRGGILFLVEGDRWLVTLIGGGRDYPPTDDDAFLEFARSLRAPHIYDAIRRAEPLSPIRGYRGTENRLRHFESAERQPENFIALGDSVCAFNPVYGQGMTIAAMGAIALKQCLQERKQTHAREGDAMRGGLARRFQRQLAKVNAAPWMLATGEDLRYRETEGASPKLGTRFMHRYMNQVLRLSSFNPTVRRVLLNAFSMLVPPTALFHPRVALRVLRQALLLRRRPERVARPMGLRSNILFDSAHPDLEETRG